MTTAKLDLTTIGNLEAWLKTELTDDEKVTAQDCITAASIYWLAKTGREAVDGVSPFVQPVTYDEWYDGPGNARLFVRNTPLRSVTSLQVNGVTVPESTAFGIRGYVIDNARKSLVIRSGGSTRQTYGGFAEGCQNVHLVSVCGFDRVPFDVVEKATIQVAVNFRRRQWIDQSSQAMANGAGTVSYRSWEIPPDVATVLDFYSRTAIVL